MEEKVGVPTSPGGLGLVGGSGSLRGPGEEDWISEDGPCRMSQRNKVLGKQALLTCEALVDDTDATESS